MTARDLTGVLLKDKWRIDARLGEGGVAAVYSATHRNGKRVAVKILHPHLSSVPEMRERFLREGYLANRVEHPGTVSVLDDDVTDDGLVFLVMDLLDGESLEHRLARQGRLEPDEVLAITESLLDVLVAAHAKGIIHRDIKPENIFLLREGGQKLLDFGIARLHEQAGAKNATQSGAAMGTPAYMPPEQARGRWELVDGRTDVWAVGATMFALLTGRSVHEAGTLNETLLLAMSQPAPALVTVWPEAPRLLAALVDRALRYDLNDRWPSASAMRGAVQAARQVRASQPELPRLPMPSQPTLPATPLEAPAAGTVLAAAVSEGAAPAQRSGLTARGRAIVAATLGGALLVVGILLLTLGRGDHGAANVAGTALAPPAASALAALPSASLTPLPPAASSVSADGPTPSASVEIDVSQLPAAPATAPQLAPPAPTPAVVARPSTPAAPAAPPTAKPAATPTSNPLDRRH